MRQTDRYWLDKIRSTQPSEFNEFFDHFFPRLYRFAMARVRDPQLAEEVVQDAMSKAVLKIDSYLGEAALFSWLCTFTRHEIYRVLTRETQKLNTLVSWEDDAFIAALDSLESITSGDPETLCGKAQLATKVQLAMASLPCQYADVLEWRYLKGFSVTEIAARMGKSYKATESLLSRSRQVFRDAFLATLDQEPGSSPVGGL